MFFDKNDNICYLWITEVNKMKKKLIGTRLPETIITELKAYCKLHGILINHFVARSIEERLRKVKRIESKKKEETQ